MFSTTKLNYKRKKTRKYTTLHQRGMHHRQSPQRRRAPPPGGTKQTHHMGPEPHNLGMYKQRLHTCSTCPGQ